MSTTAFYQSVIQGTWMNNKKKPSTIRGCRAPSICRLDRPVLVDVVKDVAPMMMGGMIYPFSDVATPLPELKKRLGYQDDTTAAVKEAKALMAAGRLRQRHQGPRLSGARRRLFKLWARRCRPCCSSAINVECTLRTVVESVWFDDIKTGNFDLAVGAIVSTLLDPSDYFNAWYKKDGPQNYGFWDNAKVQRALPQIDTRGRRHRSASR
jgi:hypothetical protein